MGELTMVQQNGIGLAAAVVVDASIIRSIRVRAAMELPGDRNRRAPRWPKWLPKLNMEGVSDEPERRSGSLPADDLV